MQGLPTGNTRQAFDQFPGCQRRLQVGNIPHRIALRLQRFEFCQSHQLAQPGVIAKGGMGVQRQVVGQQTHVVAKQGRQAPALHANDRRLFALPEVTVVDQYGIRFPGDCLVQQALAGGDASGQAGDLLSALNLEAIGTVILEPLGLQTAVQETA